jgi:hypothetical protein
MFVLRIGVLLLGLTIGTQSGLCQTDRANITGTVLDQSGAVVAGAVVRAIQVATNTERSTVSSASGEYTLAQLPVGLYRLRIEAPGFKELVRTDVDLTAGATLRIDAQLTVGQVTESVSVSAQSVLLQTESARVTTSVSPKFIQDLPLVVGGQLRSPLDLVLITPEAKNSGQIALGGGQEGGWDLTVDGVSSTPAAPFEQRLWTMVNSPSVEALNEFAVDTNGFKAEFGHAGGGAFSFVSKSGTNQFHGSAYEFIRNHAFDANSFFNNAAGQKKAVLKQNDFGATFGGPVWIPKIYNGRDRTFFFASYEGFRNRTSPGFNLKTVPLREMYEGDFSGWKTANGTLIPIYDPQTTTPAGTGFARTVFPGNRIPLNRFSNVAKNVVQYATMVPNYADPTGVLSPNPRNNFLALGGGRTDPWNKFSVKLDHQATKNNRLSFLYQKNRTLQLSSGDYPGLPVPLNNDFQYGDTYTDVYRLNHDWTISPTVLNHFVAGGNDWGQVRRAGDEQFNKGWGTKLGIKGVPDPDLLFPQLGIDGLSTWGRSEYGGSYNKSVAFGDDLSVVRGKHTLKAGWQYQRDHYDGYGQHTAAGTFNFSRLSTAIPGSTNANDSGNGFASFLLGYVSSANIETLRYVSDQWSYHALYLQDDWRVSRRLTLNLGVRWEYTPPTVEGNFPDGYSNFDPTVPNPGAEGRPGAYVFAGSGPGRTGKRSLYNAWPYGVGPRFGAAYSLNDKTVVRLSAARSFGGVKNTGGSSHFQGFIGAYSVQTTDGNVTPAFMLDNGYPPDWPKPPFLSPSVQNGSTASYWQPYDSGRLPEYYSWNFGVQRQLPANQVLEVAYNAQMGRHLTTQLLNLNQIPTSLWDSLVSRIGVQPAINLLNGRDWNAAAQYGLARPYSSFNDTVRQGLRPYPQYSSVNTGSDGGDRSGNSTYHALVVTWQKRYSNGLTFLNSYVLSKFFTDSETSNASSGGAMDHYNRRLEKTLSGNDQTHNFKFSYSYELPFGKGRPLLRSGIAGKLAGGWRVAGIHQYTSGSPRSIGPGYSLPIFAGGNRLWVMDYEGWRAKPSGGEFDPFKDLWWNTGAFNQTQFDFLPANAAQFKGVVVRNTFGASSERNPRERAPWSLNESVSLARSFNFTENVRLDIRAEAFNLFNRVRWGGPDSSVNSNTFGRVNSQANSARQMQFGAKLVF